jgi:NAD(P)-dependent dehydrogenase (short-subunit alcohol dehydrogenase family)
MSNIPIRRKTAIVTGTSGISAAVAEQMADELEFDGFILLYLNDSERANALAVKISSRPNVRDVIAIQGNISTPAGCDEVVNNIFSVVNERLNGQLTAVIHSGGHLFLEMMLNLMDIFQCILDSLP